MGITKVKHSFMAFIQYLSQAESESLVNSFVPKLENYGMNISKNLIIQSNFTQNSRVLK